MRYYSIPTDAVGQWLLDGDALDTNNGTKNHGTASNMARETCNVGYQRKAWVFNGSSSYIETGSNILPAVVNNCALSVWVYNNSNSTMQSIFANGNNAPDMWWLFWIKLDWANNTYNFTKPWIINENTGVTPALGRWQHLVLQIINYRWYLYVDGALAWAGSNTSSVSDNTSTIKIGVNRLWWPLVTHYNGKMRGIRLYDRELKQTEVTALYLEGINGLWGGGSPLLKNLSAYYDFNGDTQDIMNRYHGTATWPTLTTDRFWLADHAYSFDGVDDYIIATHWLGTGDINFSASAWIYVTGSQTRGDIIRIGNGNPTGGREGVLLYVWAKSGGNDALYYEDLGSNELSTTARINYNAWNFVSLSKTGTSITLGVNGVYETFTTSSLNISSTALFIGRRSVDSTAFNGKIDDVMTHTVGLSEAEMTGIYETSKNRFIYPYKKQLPLHLRDGLRMWLTGEHTGATYHNVVDSTTSATSVWTTADSRRLQHNICKLDGSSGLYATNYVNNNNPLTMRLQFFLNEDPSINTWGTLIADRQSACLGHWLTYWNASGTYQLMFAYHRPNVGSATFTWQQYLEPWVMHTVTIVQGGGDTTYCYLDGSLLGTIVQWWAGFWYNSPVIWISYDPEWAAWWSPSHINISWTNYMFYDRAITPKEEKELFYSLYI